MTTFSKKDERYIKGRGSQINTPNRFEDIVRSTDPDSAPEDPIRTTFIPSTAKTIVNKVDSPDVPFDYSINPYQGCEHGCVYCYARNSHNYWGYSAGLDFETKIVVKTNAPDLLRKRLKSKTWKASPIMLSGNTDCYQPAERAYKLTRQLLEIFLHFGHPVGLITKNSLILRDLDLLKALNEDQLVSVAVSINTIDDEIRRFLEPRTATIAKRLEVVKKLSEEGIPVTVLAAPMIPSLTDAHIFDLVKACAEAGARNVHYQVVRLNGDIATIFEDWLRKNAPDRAQRILNQIKSAHKGKLNDSEFAHRMKGSGQFADMIGQQFKLAKKKYFPNPKAIELNTTRYGELKDPQLRLF